ncbi:uncharacterized protein BX664DRAFT_338291 [Halteromyces radiatus]|uniref:uncharacterized protein n=1 Tax=Halteromyces radiatus TaxID=101107 RepID=UPI00221EB9F5|nr:uncharacterized protein BX664DRAFT_338291 [Halteromyces radiatus]KAI8084995.1 hypothetical protein BX664DRAFT_338291 [Halteromyces radiatus]
MMTSLFDINADEFVGLIARYVDSIVLTLIVTFGIYYIFVKGNKKKSVPPTSTIHASKSTIETAHTTDQLKPQDDNITSTAATTIVAAATGIVTSLSVLNDEGDDHDKSVPDFLSDISTSSVETDSTAVGGVTEQTLDSPSIKKEKDALIIADKGDLANEKVNVMEHEWATLDSTSNNEEESLENNATNNKDTTMKSSNDLQENLMAQSVAVTDQVEFQERHDINLNNESIGMILTDDRMSDAETTRKGQQEQQSEVDQAEDADQVETFITNANENDTTNCMSTELTTTTTTTTMTITDGDNVALSSIKNDITTAIQKEKGVIASTTDVINGTNDYMNDENSTSERHEELMYTEQTDNNESFTQIKELRCLQDETKSLENSSSVEMQKDDNSDEAMGLATTSVDEVQVIGQTESMDSSEQLELDKTAIQTESLEGQMEKDNDIEADHQEEMDQKVQTVLVQVANQGELFDPLVDQVEPNNQVEKADDVDKAVDDQQTTTDMQEEDVLATGSAISVSTKESEVNHALDSSFMIPVYNKPKQDMSRLERIGQQLQPYIPLYKSRCEFWPGCTNNHCKYYHPYIECRNGKTCQFGKKCIFLHPNDYVDYKKMKQNGQLKKKSKKNNTKTSRRKQQVKPKDKNEHSIV